MSDAGLIESDKGPTMEEIVQGTADISIFEKLGLIRKLSLLGFLHGLRQGLIDFRAELDVRQNELEALKITLNNKAEDLANREALLEKNKKALAYENLVDYVEKNFERLYHMYDEIISQANRSFWTALIASLFALAFFAYSMNDQEHVNIALVGSTFSGFVSAINFYLYRKTSAQVEVFHDAIYDIERLLFANSICDKLKDDNSINEARKQVIERLAYNDKSSMHHAVIGNNDKDQPAGANT